MNWCVLESLSSGIMMVECGEVLMAGVYGRVTVDGITVNESKQRFDSKKNDMLLSPIGQADPIKCSKAFLIRHGTSLLF